MKTKKEHSGSRISSLRWILFVSRRFARVDTRGRSAVTSFLSALGICFGVMTLIVTISVMNGFQMSFIDAIMEISSYHVRVASPAEETASETLASEDTAFEQWCGRNPLIASVTPFYEAQALVSGYENHQAAALIRAVPPDICTADAGFARELKLYSGRISLKEPNSIVLGTELARQLGVRVGETVNLFALSGGRDVDLLSADRVFTVTGTFKSGYADINAGYAFISIEDGRRYFGSGAQRLYGLKLVNSAHDAVVISQIQQLFPRFAPQSWRTYNRAFFGALRVEKNLLMMLVFLIFVVVAINIYNGMRRMVYERHEEIAVISALGGSTNAIQAVFIMQGFLTGAAGSLPGLALGLLLSVRMDAVFMAASRITYWAQYFWAMLVNPAAAGYVTENPMFSLYAQLPARIVPGEVLMITIFGMFSALAAAWFASRGVLKLQVAEVLRDE